MRLIGHISHIGHIGHISHIRHISHIGHIGHIGLVSLVGLGSLTSCYREPLLHLYDEDNPEIDIPMPQMRLDVYWDVSYQTNFGFSTNWRADWYYGLDQENGIEGWDKEDRQTFGVQKASAHQPISFTASNCTVP